MELQGTGSRKGPVQAQAVPSLHKRKSGGTSKESYCLQLWTPTWKQKDGLIANATSQVAGILPPWQVLSAQMMLIVLGLPIPSHRLTGYLVQPATRYSHLWGDDLKELRRLEPKSKTASAQTHPIANRRASWAPCTFQGPCDVSKPRPVRYQNWEFRTAGG